MSYDYSQILLPGNCYVSPYAIGLPVTDYGYSCASRFYCPNATSSVTKSLPQLCSATAGCVATRLKTSLCTPQGPYEPSICPPGYYCPDPKTIYQCPEGSWCPTGTSVPRTCPSLSSCPVGTVAPKYYGGIVICAIVDFVLVVLYVGVKYRQRGVGNVLKRVFGKGGQVGGGGQEETIYRWCCSWSCGA
ncbi:hypothetical protein BDR26DRAFT_183811 [Obelidium mucronatum]|nr:hypothetical protein BDR26DRAFT_183811 [Obelidium mucronatum]